MKIEVKHSVVIILLVGLPVVAFLYLYVFKSSVYTLPRYGEFTLDTLYVDGKIQIDTIYHTIPPFRLVNQLGDTITEADLRGKIYVANFFFTRCAGICPVMTQQMKRVQKELEKTDMVKIVSHSVDPIRDSVPILKRYADKYGVNHKQWYFLTGERDSMYELIQRGYFLPIEENDGTGTEDFIHSDRFVLVDGDGVIRGYYSGTDSVSVNKLIKEMKLLLIESYRKEQVIQGRNRYLP